MDVSVYPRVREPPMKLITQLFATAMMCALPIPLSAQATPTTWKATELWRVDGSDGGEPFGAVRDMVVGKDGALWVLDYKDQQLRRFDSNGKPLATVGRLGSGPGEMRKANGLLVTRDGSVWINDPTQKRFSVFSASGAFEKQFVVTMGGYGFRWNAWLDRRTGDVMDLAIVRRPGATTSTSEWRRISTTGTIGDTIAMPTCAAGGEKLFNSFEARSKNGNMVQSYAHTRGGGQVADGNGAMWCAMASSNHAVLVRIGKNDTIAQTNLKLIGAPVHPLERDSAIALAKQSIAQYETNTFDASRIPANKPPMLTLAVDDDGRLWIQHSARMNAQHVTFDVHDRAGKHLGRLRIPHRLSVEEIPVRARGNDLWVAVRDDDDVVQIVKYRVGR